MFFCIYVTYISKIKYEWSDLAGMFASCRLLENILYDLFIYYCIGNLRELNDCYNQTLQQWEIASVFQQYYIVKN